MRAAAGARAGGRGGLRWLLLLLVIPVVAVVLFQLRPDANPSASPTSTSSPSTAHRGPTGRAPSVTQLGSPPFGITGDWDLFASGGGVLVRIDFARDRLTTTTVPSLGGEEPVWFVATSAGAMVRPMNSVPGYLVPDGKPARQLTGELATHGPVVPGPDLDHVWVDLGNGFNRGAIRLVGLDGRPGGPAITEPANAQGWIVPDGGGYPLVQTTAGIYTLRPDGARRVVTGVLLASGPTGWLVVGCDERNHCTGSVVDRGSGRRRSLPDLPAALTDARGAMSPDGRTAALVGSGAEGRSRLWLVDLGSGVSSEVNVRPGPRADVGRNAIAWSPDGRWVLLVDDRGALLAVDTATERVRHLGLDLPELNQLVVRDSP